MAYPYRITLDVDKQGRCRITLPALPRRVAGRKIIASVLTAALDAIQNYRGNVDKPIPMATIPHPRVLIDDFTPRATPRA